jgi:hypothetical protein
MNSKVYFFSDGEAIKIGACTTGDLRQRKWQLQVGSKHFLEIIGWINTDFPFELEKSLHVLYAGRKIYRPTGTGEWFDLTISEAIKVIKEYENGYEWNNNSYVTACGNPAHTVRPLWRGQQDTTGCGGQSLPERKGGMLHSCLERVQSVVRSKLAIGGKAFLRQAGS